MELDNARVKKIIKAALKEDIGRGDITSNCIVPKLKSAKAALTANETCVICGINIVEWTFASLDYSLRFKPQFEDGGIIHAGEDAAFISGNARSILAGERLALNFISMLSGIATETRKYVDKTRQYGTKILDTRKTFPLLRYLVKYAVTVGGGCNHRMTLGDMVMFKDNHIKLSDNTIDIPSIRAKVERDTKIEVEIDSLDEFERVITSRPDIIMLDNMTVEDVAKAVKLRNEKKDNFHVCLEASGGITLENVEAYARTGVDSISVGAITDSVNSVDFSLNVCSYGHF